MPNELELLRAEVARLQRRLEQLEATQAGHPLAAAGVGGSRRQLLTLAAGAAASAVVAGVVTARPAAATDGDPMFVGWTHQSMLGTTVMPGTNSQQVGSELLAGSAVFNVTADGVPADAAPRAIAANGALGTGVEADGLTTGVLGRTVDGIAGRFEASGTGFGVTAVSQDSVGVVAGGRVGSLQIAGAAGGLQPPPPQRGLDATAGLVDIDANLDVWLCVQAGTPGRWRKLGGPATAGAFHPIPPQRVYDSRVSVDGPLQPNTSRVIGVADGRGPSGAVTAAGVVPAGATAITFNLTATGPTGPNYLSVVPGDAIGFTTSTLNFPGGFDCANGSVVLLGGDRTVRVFCGDQSGSTHAIIDVTGYYA